MFELHLHGFVDEGGELASQSQGAFMCSSGVGGDDISAQCFVLENNGNHNEKRRFVDPTMT
jgi:hypothetical protein